jgi:hypothetical protein
MANAMSEAEAKAKEALREKQNAPSTEVATRPTTAAGIAQREQVMTQFADMAAVLPRAEEDASMSIVAQILGATGVEELDAPWRDTEGDELVGVILEITDVTVHASDYTDGLGVFLRVEGKRLDNQQPVAFSTGSVSTVAQLVKAYVSHWFPLVVEIVKAPRPTKRGYYPLHLRIITGPTTATQAS